MKARACELLLSIFILFIVHANTALTLPANSTVPANGTDLNFIKTGVNCFPETTFARSRLGSVRDCIQAALLLPDGADPGDFHTGGDSSHDLRLPVARTFRTCVATVTLTDPSTDRSSWDHVSFVAGQMVTVCAVGGPWPLGTTGGVSYVGASGHIRITLERKPR